ncbi:MAG: DUF7282 domain-containing protein [Alphaproteobacteria bacterium]
MFLIFAIIIAVSGAAFFFRAGEDDPLAASGSSGLIVGENTIYVAEQPPGPSVSASLVRLRKRGFVVIHDDAAGRPGRILGASGLLAAGETKNLPPVTLSRATRDGETIYAMLHFDNGNGKFDVADDKAVLDPESGAPMMMIVSVSKHATEPGIINP